MRSTNQPKNEIDLTGDRIKDLRGTMDDELTAADQKEATKTYAPAVQAP